METKGVLHRRSLPDPEFDRLYDRIVLPREQKSRVVSQMLLEFTLRGKLDRGGVPLHGVILLTGPPGTGKTSFAKGAASKVAAVLGRSVEFIEAEPHALTSSALGKSQRAVRDFLHGAVAEAALKGPTIVLLDEVETMAASRTKLSLEANPVDVHRATDAVLAGLDRLAEDHPHLLFVATTNFEGAVDEAFLSRADLVEHIGRPNPEACREIRIDTLQTLAEKWPPIKSLLDGNGLRDVAALAEGLDGRQIRKAVLRALALDKEVALDPGRLSLEHLRQAFGGDRRSAPTVNGHSAGVPS